jgi:hypothetical protein
VSVIVCLWWCAAAPEPAREQPLLGRVNNLKLNHDVSCPTLHAALSTSWLSFTA